MTKEEAIRLIEKADITVYREIKTKTAIALEMAIEALKADRCYLGSPCEYQNPKVKIPQKVGKWIEKDGWDGDVYYDCSACGESWMTIEGTPWENDMNYCPHCGAKMEGEE